MLLRQRGGTRATVSLVLPRAGSSVQAGGQWPPGPLRTRGPGAIAPLACVVAPALPTLQRHAGSFSVLLDRVIQFCCRLASSTDFPVLVVKTCVSVSGKRLFITRDKDEACRAVQHLTKDWIPGATTVPIIVEEFLQGEEFYCLGITDGSTLAPIPPVHIPKPGDSHKSQLPSSSLQATMSEDVSRNIHCNILKKTIDGLRQEGWNYIGLFGAKVMVTARGPVVLGFRCTFQDLDHQDISPLLNSDLYDVIQTAVEGKLSSYLLAWSPNTSLSYPSSKQRDIQGTICSDDDGSVDLVHQRTGRSSAQIPSETPADVSCASHAAEIGSKALMNTHRPSGQTALFEVNMAQYKDPVFLCTTNSLGNKIKVAQACSLHRLAAQHLVMECMNDLLSQGAQTLFFMPYFACGKLQSETVESILEGLDEACKTTESSLLERAIVQQSVIHHDGCYSLSGYALGVVEREYQLPRPEQMREGDLVVGVHAPGLYCSSLDLLRKILERHSFQFTSTVPISNVDATWGEMVMSSISPYSPSLLQVLRSDHIRACIPLTEGGLVGSILRCLPRSMGIVIDALCWKIPPVYSWLYKDGELSEKELVENFSCGLGAVIIVKRTATQQILAALQQNEEAWLVGGLIQHASDVPRVRVIHLVEAMKVNTFQHMRAVILKKTTAKVMKVALFISNTGMKLKILINLLRHLASSAKLALIISNKSAIEELRKAVSAGIPTRVIDHTLFTCHSDYENTICKVLDEFSIDVICLAGFRRTLSEEFLGKWRGKILKLHAQLSPSQEVEGASGKPAGLYSCTVSFLLGGSSSPGPTILQETVLADSEVPVTEYMEEAEPIAVAKALHLLSSGTIHLGSDNYISWRTED